jgi:hypothetical protein
MLRHSLGSTVRYVTLVFCLTICAVPLRAQCPAGSVGSIGMEQISLQAGKPFFGDRIQTAEFVAKDGTKQTQVLRGHVARDNTGRGRIERPVQILGPNASEAEIAAAWRSTLICDPVSGTFIQLSSNTRTATVRHSTSPPRVIVTANSHPWTGHIFPNSHTKPTPNVQFEDLGLKVIEGVEAHGGRFTRTGDTNSETGDSLPRVTEIWASDELGVTLVEILSSPTRGTSRTELVNLTLKQPDASLFEIPLGYTVTEETGSAKLEPKPH